MAKPKSPRLFEASDETLSFLHVLAGYTQPRKARKKKRSDLIVSNMVLGDVCVCVCVCVCVRWGWGGGGGMGGGGGGEERNREVDPVSPDTVRYVRT